MRTSSIYLFSYSIVLMFLVSCASYKAQYKNEKKWDATLLENEKNLEIAHTFYAIGDAGNANLNENLTHFNLLKNELSSVDKNATLLFLGDNLYEKGLPKKSHPTRKISEHRLNAQINLVENFKGKTIFIPGNHDYYNQGIKGLKREQDYITDRLGKDSFFPKDGCPIKKIDISDDLVLIIIDSQWYLENWDKNPTMNDNCDIKTRELFFDEFESLIKKNELKTTIVAMHHPLFSNGSHGGQFSFKSQLYPVNNNFPLPIIGTLANIFRTTSGISVQDLNNSLYLELKNRIVTLAQKAEKVIFISGHEHNLQYIVQNNIPQIISGSGSKTAAARVINGSEFSYGGLGYAKVVLYKNGATDVYFYTEAKEKKILLFKKEIYTSKKDKEIVNFPVNFPKTETASIYSTKEISKGSIYLSLWGKHYRKYYGTKVTAPTVLLDTLFGGLKPIKTGGGHQSKSLRLEDKNGRQFVMRALKKSATQYLQAVAFKNQYIEGQFENTYTEDLLLDIYTTSHPYAPFTIGKLADAINLFHTNPTLYYVPKQNALSNFNNEFGDELYMIEEHASDNHNIKSFGYSKELIGTDDLLKNLRKSDDFLVDEDAYIRARLFDMLIGDWDRHEDQWRWATFKNGNKTTYKPVPRDRDQAFSKNDGLILGFLTRAIPALKLMQVFNEDIRNVKWFNLEPYPLDMALINKADFASWNKQVKFIQQNITPEIVDEAFKNFPTEVHDKTIFDIKKKLLGRLKNLPKIAKIYYKHLAKYAVVKGNDKDNLFEIERLINGKTLVKIYNIKNNEKGTKFFQKIYSKEETSEIWIYGLDDKDVFKVTGVKNNIIPIRIIGGQNNDIYNIENKKRVTIYDYKTKKNTFNNLHVKTKLTNNYKTNVYNYKKLKYNQNQIMPSIGSNPDDGFRVGIINTYTVFGFERNPFTQQHTINASYYFSNKGYDISYNAEYANIFRNWNLLVETKFTSPNYSINFYNFGNETQNFENEFNDNYHRVKISTYAVNPFLKWKGRLGSEFKIGPLFESIEVENTANRYINAINYKQEKRKTYTGIHTFYSYENYDNKAFPTLGMNFSLEAGWKQNIEKNTENNGFFSPSLGINYKIISNGKIVFATKFKGNIIFGDTFEFYNAATIGGIDGLRGFRNQRFTGNSSFYQNSDIRFNLRNVKTELVPMQFGIFTGFDYGRVWLKNENSNDWKTAYGGGLWLTGADMLNLNLSIFNSKDGAYVKFGLGFGF
ncbi:metallophosphoesterase [Lutibacter maritimus]|uniref:Calcineurin-like phosphoesterase n=1 Tax=Lutibacter maritimus TaxID=593133 RepID=A0A1I6NPN8_9FLAO|nr:metallophosphoesterase [Lutibacter maritimus]SFS29829.1 Calcineurin-like phosphoesterase [Lutibacter maritimus]